jgi:AcrR family transcriptional regulator
VTFVRARQPEQKEERRAALLTTARAMLDEGTPLDALGLNALARQAGMTKSNVYRYFESREAVLLELLKEEWFAWSAELTTTWAPPEDPAASLRALTRHMAEDPAASLRALTRHMAATLARRPRLCQLTSVLPSVLEQNVSEDAVVAFKLLTRAFFEETAAFMCRAVPGLSLAAGLQLMQDGAVVITGLWPHAHPAAAVQRAIAQTPSLSVFRWDFEADLARLLHAVAVAAVTARSP